MTDAPAATGTEVQEKIMDVCYIDGSIERRVMPGASLVCGQLSGVHEAIAVLWSAWLVAGATD
eukprot:998384-Pyramimonas_sp.AAC.1